MSRQVTWEDIDKDNPDPDDVRYLLQRGMVPSDRAEAVQRWIEQVDSGDEDAELDSDDDGENLGRMTKAKLAELAESEGIDLEGASTKAEMVAAIEAAREAAGA